MKKIFYLILILHFVSCKQNSKDNKNLVPNDEVYGIINYILKNDLQEKDSKYNYLSEEFPLENPNNQYFGIEEMDTIFSKKDIEFMKLQMDNRYHFRIENSLIQDRTVISFDSLNKLFKENERSEKFWERFEKKYKAKKFSAISLPIFSVDYKTVLISFGNHCGSLCGSGKTVIYKKVNGKWKQIKTISFWVS